MGNGAHHTGSALADELAARRAEIKRRLMAPKISPKIKSSSLSSSRFPPLPVQRIKSVEERIAEADKFCNEISAPAMWTLKNHIRKSDKECKPLAKTIIPRWGIKTISEVVRLVAATYDVSVIDILSRRRIAKVMRPRQIAMYLSRELTTRSLPEIGRMFDNRDHTTIMHDVHKIAGLIETDKALAGQIAMLKEKLRT